MKKKLLCMTLILSSFIASAQFEVRETNTDNLISNGQEIAFAEAGCDYSDPCNWKFKVTNTSADPIYMRIFVDGLDRTDGSNFQLCFAGVCLNNVTLGSGYPSTAAMIGPGVTNEAGNNMWNQNPPETTQAMSWIFRFQAFDESDNEIGTPLTLTYRYDSSLSIEESDFVDVSVYPTVADNTINIMSNEELSASIYDLLGKKVKQINVYSGENAIDVSNLYSQPYILRLTNNEGQQVIKKIIIK